MSLTSQTREEIRFHPYKHSSMTNLAWFITSPMLFNDVLKSKFNQTFNAFNVSTRLDETYQWLLELDQKPDRIQFIDGNRFKRIGLYYEALFEFWLTQGFKDGIHHFELHHKNLQLINGKTTLGELDFVIDHKGQLIHVETAIKFYLLHRNENADALGEWQNWIGPNARDRLDIKLSKMLNHQLPLAETFKKQYEIEKQIESRYRLQGRFFLPFTDRDSSAICLPASSNPEVDTGIWARKSEFIAFLKKTQSVEKREWLPLEKHQWITGEINDRYDERKISSSRLLNLLEQGAKPVSNTRYRFDILPLHLAQKTANNKITFLMIVEDYWPQTI